MDATNIKSDLQALQRLYGLLRNDRDGVSNLVSDTLDKHSRLLLKNLLDTATQRVLKAHAQMIADRVEASSLVSPTPTPTPTPQANTIVTEAVTRSFGKGHGSNQKRQMNGQDTWTKHRFTPERTVGASVPEYRKKRCMVCQKSTVKQLEFIQESNSDNVAQNSNRYTYFQHQRNDQTEPLLNNKEQEPGSVDFNRNHDYSEMGKQTGTLISDLRGFTDFSSETADESQEVNRLSKEAYETIKEIESCISALQPGEDQLYLFGTRSDQPNSMLRLSTGQFNIIRGQALESTLSNEQRESVEERNMPTLEVNPDHGQKVKSIIEKIESGKWRTQHDNFLLPYVQNFTTAQDKNKTSNRVPNWPTASSSVSKPENQERSVMAMKDKSMGYVTFQPYKPSENSPQLIANTYIDCGERHTRNGRGTIVVDENGVPKNRNYYTKRGKSLWQHEMEKTSSPISYSSSWRSEQNSTYGRDSEEIYFPGTDSESGSFPQSREFQSQYSTSTSNSEEDAYSSLGSDEARELTSSNSSKCEGYSTKVGPSRIRKKTNEINRKKQTGTWKRLKDRLAVVFHHHHHHHHHNDDDVNRYIKGKSFLSKREAEVCEEKAVEKMRKSVVRGKKQQNHFSGLMGAVLSHVRRSKKNKAEKTVPLGKSRGGSKKGVKKSKQELWKLGVGKKKPRLKALPKIK